MENTLKNFQLTTLRSLIVLLIPFILVACGSNSTISTKVAILSQYTLDEPASNSSQIALEQLIGYEEGLKLSATKFDPIYLDERIPQSDNQRAIRDLVEDTKAPLISILGASTNNGTSYAAALVNFFNVPMVIPSANGDVLFSSDNLWAFRLSADGNAYANFFFGSIINKNSMTAILTDPNGAFFIPPDFKVAILYEQNTFGETAAVATANAAIAQSFKIGLYKNFDTKTSDPASLIDIAKLIKDSKAQLVYIVVSDPALAKNIIQSIKNVYPVKFLPVMVGQAGGFTSQEFLSSVEANGVYVLQQSVKPTMCPDSIRSNIDALSYGSVYILDQAHKLANNSLRENQNWWERFIKKEPTVKEQREAIRDALKQTNMDVPCLGNVVFDNTGQNKSLNLELIQIVNRNPVLIESTEFLDALESRLSVDQLQ